MTRHRPTVETITLTVELVTNDYHRGLARLLIHEIDHLEGRSTGRGCAPASSRSPSRNTKQSDVGLALAVVAALPHAVLIAAGKTGEEAAAELGVSAATMYNWRRQYGSVDTDAAKDLKELREQNARLKRLLAGAELEKDALREIALENSEPSAKRRAVDMLKQVKGMSGRLACKVVGLHRSTYRRLPAAQTPEAPDAGLWAWAAAYATRPRGTGFRRAWAALRFDEGAP